MAREIVSINRAPVLTLWAVVVAERLGFGRDEALSLGRALAGLCAQTKGRSLGLFKPAEKPEEARPYKPGEEYRIILLGFPVPAMNTESGVRALDKDKIVDPAGTERYLEGKFGDRLAEVEKALTALARSFGPSDLEAKAFALYERFRPAIPEGIRGWGARGELDLALIKSLALPPGRR